MLSELKRCQKANGNGYIGGVPDSKHLWEEVKKGNIKIVWKSWVPWYNLHKTFAGLRDAWLYGNSQEAKDMFLKLCDWGIDIISPLNEKQMEEMQKEVEAAEFEASVGGGAVTVKVNGKKEVIDITIKPEVVDPDDIEMLQDLVLSAVNEALRSVDEMQASQMSKVTGGMNIPGLF